MAMRELHQRGPDMNGKHRVYMYESEEKRRRGEERERRREREV